MKKLYFVLILFLTVFSQLDAQIFYNIEMPLSYQKNGLKEINELPSIKFNVDNTGNLFKGKLSTNVKDYLLIEKIGDKNIGRLKFNVSALSLGEMTLRFRDVNLKGGVHCYVYSSDYEIVAGPVYEKSISNVLNIVKIPANELILEIVFNSVNDFNLILNSISFQSIIDVSKKNDNSLQEAIPDSNWDCSSCIYGYKDFVDNANTISRKSWYGADYLEELFTHTNLYSVNDLKLDAARASCMIMTPDGGTNYMAYPGTLINFPGSDCKGLVISVAHNSDVFNICKFTRLLVLDEFDDDWVEDTVEPKYIEYLNNSMIRFNWHHKYGKPLHLINKCNPDTTDFKLWRKTIDFDEVIDYCGVKGFAYSDLNLADYAIIRMVQMPFYKELHLGWTTQHDFERDPLGTERIKNSEYYSILGHHAATPTYVYKNSLATNIEGNNKTKGFNLNIIPYTDNPVSTGHFHGWSGAQLLAPEYTRNGLIDSDTTKKIGLGLIFDFGNVEGRTAISNNYDFCFNERACYVCDPDLSDNGWGPGNNLYTKYLSRHADELDSIGDFYWMPSKENREKCPSTLGGGTDPCTFDLTTKMEVVYTDDGTMEIIIRIGEISSGDFQGNQIPKGIRIYNTLGDQQTFYFDSFADGIKIDSVIRFTISQCDIFYYQMMGLTKLNFGIDFYDIQGRILNATDCNKKYSFLFPNTLCEAFTVTNERISGPPFDSCCSYRIMINFKGCDDYSNIFRRMLEVLRIKNLNTQLETLITNQIDLNLDYDKGTISFVINNICSPTSYKLIALFGGPKNCESFEFALDCVVPESSKDCCKLFNLALKELWCQYTSSFDYYRIPFGFFLYFTETKNETYPPYCPDYQLISAHVYCPNSGPSLPPVYDEILTPTNKGRAFSEVGTFEGSAPGTYCFYADITTNHGICHDTLCVYYNGTFFSINPSPPGPIINIDESNNSNNLLPLSNKLEYEKITIEDLNGKVLIESETIDKNDVSKLPKGTYNILYRKNDKIMQTQKLIIK